VSRGRGIKKEISCAQIRLIQQSRNNVKPEYRPLARRADGNWVSVSRPDPDTTSPPILCSAKGGLSASAASSARTTSVTAASLNTISRKHLSRLRTSRYGHTDMNETVNLESRPPLLPPDTDWRGSEILHLASRRWYSSKLRLSVPCIIAPTTGLREAMAEYNMAICPPRMGPPSRHSAPQCNARP
jgi:hypothetical protein